MIVSFYFIYRKIVGLNINIFKLQKPVLAIMLLIVFSIIYLLNIFIGSFAWKLNLEFVGESKIDYRDIIKVYMKANIGKYLPGNAMHFAGRKVIGNKLGWKNSHIALSSMLEVIYNICTAVLLVFIFSFHNLIYFVKKFYYSNYKNDIMFAVILLFFLCIVIFIKFSKKLNSYIKEKILTKNFLKLSIKELFLYSCCFVINGCIVILILKYILLINIQLKDISAIIIANTFAWVIGYITPGAPGGLGVRESILTVTLSSMYNTNEIVMASLLYRFVCILGDIYGLLISIRHLQKNN
jgi:uncharacterized membrane protein YbhN (UPF0104 family)